LFGPWGRRCWRGRGLRRGCTARLALLLQLFPDLRRSGRRRRRRRLRRGGTTRLTLLLKLLPDRRQSGWRRRRLRRGCTTGLTLLRKLFPGRRRRRRGRALFEPLNPWRRCRGGFRGLGRGWRSRVRRRWRRRRRRGVRRWRRRCGMGRWRRGRGMRRGCCCGRRRCRTRRGRGSLRCLLRLRFSVGTKLLLGLGHDQRRGLRVGCRACELHGRKSCRGEQYETKSCHDGLGPRGKSGRKVWRSTNKRAALWRLSKAELFLFLTTESPNASSFIAHSDHGFKSNFYMMPCVICAAESRSVAGEGVDGPCGPRTGNSSGIRPGNSSGGGGSPGSCTGGGTSGRGLPGGLSCGGSDGCPGLIGGSSCGSIGISPLLELWSGNVNSAAAAMFPRLRVARASVMVLFTPAVRGTPPRYYGRPDRARRRRNNWSDSGRARPARRCRARLPPSPS